MTAREVVARQLDLARERVATLEAVLAELDRVPAPPSGFVAVAPAPHANGKPVRKPKAERNGKASLIPERRKRVAALLRSGPLTVKDLAEKTDIPTSCLHAVLKCDWFAKGPELRDPWALTEVGERAAGN